MSFNFPDFMEGLKSFAEVGTDIMKWLNSNVFNLSSGFVNALKSIIDFFSGLFKGGDGGFLGGLGDFFGGLFS